MMHIYNGISLSHKKNEILAFVAAWMLSEISQRQISYDITYVWNLKIIQMNLYRKEKQTHRQKNLWFLKGRRGRDKQGLRY